MKNILGYVTVFLLWTGSLQAQTLVAEVDSNEVPLGEVFNLNLTYDGADGGTLQPDLSVLQQDFSIYSTSSSTQVSIINGRTSHRQDWDIGLIAKHEGKMTIPEILVGKSKSQPLNINVLPAGTNVTTNKKDRNAYMKNDNTLAEAAKFSVNLTVDKKQAYLQQEVNAEVVINEKMGLQLTSEPQFGATSDWLVKSLGNPQVSQQNGEREIRFQYALFPQKSGLLRIPSVKINGFYVSSEMRQKAPVLQQGFNSLFQMMSMDFDDMFGVKKPVELYTKPVEIKVLPVVSEWNNNWWIPAESLKLQAFWEQKKPLFKIGETVAREIVITASGVDEMQLPELDLSAGENFKQYPENPQLTSEVHNGKIVSQSVIRVVYIPQNGGEQILPEIKLPWFNVKTKKIEMATIPAEKVFVEGLPQKLEKRITETAQKEHIEKEEKENVSLKQKNEKMEFFSLKIVIACVIGAFMLGLLLSRFFLNNATNKKAENKKNNSAWCSRISKDLEVKDYRALRDDLLKWGNEEFCDTRICNLNDLSENVNEEEFRNQLYLLNQSLYGDKMVELDAKKILKIIKSCHLTKKSKAVEEPLPKLYK